MALQDGDQAPDFRLGRDGGGTLSLADFAGTKLVLYAYPKDDTPSCTQEAIAFNGLRGDFAAADTQIIGISPDPVKKHDKFKSKYGLDFPLVADETLWRCRLTVSGSRRACMAGPIWACCARLIWWVRMARLRASGTR